MADVRGYVNGPYNASAVYMNASNASDYLVKPPDRDHVMTYVMVTMQLLTFVFGITGNALVIYIIAYFNKVREKSVANYYIWNLAVADELFVLALPLFAYNTYTQQWPFADTWFGDASCRIAYLLLNVNKFVSVFTLVALSADRYLASYLASYHRLAYLRTIQVGKVIIGSIWAICLLLCLPMLLYTRIKHTSYDTVSCSLDWPQPKLAYHWFWAYFVFLIALLIPIILIFGSYVMLLRQVRALVRLQKKSGRRMTQTVVVVVVMFLVCQTPYHILNFIHVYQMDQYLNHQVIPSPRYQRLHSYLYGIAQILVFVSSCCNPIIYALFNENFRKLYRLVLCKCRAGRRRPEDFRELELDERNASMNLKIRVTWHVPCPFPKPRPRKQRQNPSGSLDTRRPSLDDTASEPAAPITTTL